MHGVITDKIGEPFNVDNIGVNSILTSLKNNLQYSEGLKNWNYQQQNGYAKLLLLYAVICKFW